MFSLRRADREQLARSDKSVDRRLIGLLRHPHRLIATILIGNESVNVATSAVMAALVESLFPGEGNLKLALVATFFAVSLLLFFGEITPKTIAMKTSNGWARRAARPLWLFGLLVTPIRLVVRALANGLLRPFGLVRGDSTPVALSEDEFKALVDAGSAEGEVDPRERRLIHKVFEFGDKTVADIMLPRDKVLALSYDLPMARLVKEVAARGYSRVPIYQRRLDNVRGILHVKDLAIQASNAARPKPLSEILHEPVFVPRTAPLANLFAVFKRRKTHMALVVNEYGKLAGLVTMEDVLEELFGEIRDERELQKERAVVPVRPGSEPPVDDGDETSTVEQGT